MCFRPAEADAASGVGPTPCPHCGKTVFPTEGLLPKKCPFCREELSADGDPAGAAPSAPAAPGAPGAPAAPAAPSAPTAPGVSDDPMAPNAPTPDITGAPKPPQV